MHWIIIYYAHDAAAIILARFLSGVTGGAVFICIPLFVAEVATETVRGRLSSTMQVSFYGGIVLGYTAGTFLDYFTLPPVLVVLPVAFFVWFVWLPSTPQYLVRCGDVKVRPSSIVRMR